MGERMFDMSTCEGPKEDEISSQVHGKLRIQRGRADRPPKDLHDRIGNNQILTIIYHFTKLAEAVPSQTTLAKETCGHLITHRILW